MDKVIAERYAESLFELAVEMQAVDKYRKDMKLVDEVLESDPSFVPFFSHVLVPNDVKWELIDKSFKGNVDPYVLNFLKLLVRKRRIKAIREIVKSFIALTNKSLGIEEGIIYSPFDLTDKQVKDVEEALSKKEHKQIILQVRKDPSLVGGIKVQVANKVYDGSIKNRVSRLKAELLRK